MKNTNVWRVRTMKSLSLYAFAVFSVCGLTAPAYAQEVVSGNDIVVGTRALGMGGAQIAAVEDVTAVIHNPAALTRLKNYEILLGLDMLKKKNETALSAEYVSGTGSAQESAGGLGSFGFAYPVPTERGSLVFALSYNRVKEFSGLFRMDGFDEYAFETDDDLWGGNFSDETFDDGSMGVYSLAGAVMVSPKVSFGLSLDVWKGTYKTDNRYLRNDFDGQVSWLDITGGEDDITAWSLKPSILYEDRNFSLGAYIRLPVTYHVKQDNYEEYYSRNDGYYFRLHENIDPNSSYWDDDYYYSTSYKVESPMEIGIGCAWGTAGKRQLAVDMTYENWKEAEFKQEYDPHYFRDKYKATMNWRVGFEQAIPGLDVIGRIGYLHQPINFKGPRLDMAGEPEITIEDERDFITFGLGKNFDENLRFDIAYARGFSKMKEGFRIDKENSNRLYASMTYRMPMILK